MLMRERDLFYEFQVGDVVFDIIRQEYGVIVEMTYILDHPHYKLSSANLYQSYLYLELAPKFVQHIHGIEHE